MNPHLENLQCDELVREDLQLVDHHSQAAGSPSGISRANALGMKNYFKFESF